MPTPIENIAAAEAAFIAAEMNLASKIATRRAAPEVATAQATYNTAQTALTAAILTRTTPMQWPYDQLSRGDSLDGGP